jgi:hypothetical protein
VAGSCGSRSEPSSSIKGEEFIDQSSDYWVLKKDPNKCGWSVQRHSIYCIGYVNQLRLENYSKAFSSHTRGKA